jgi:hypothetical protein
MLGSASLPLRSALLISVLFFSFIAAGLAFGWPGERDACAEPPYCFCEAARSGAVAQPANSGSTFGFVAMGIAIALHHGRRRRDPALANASTGMSGDPRYAALYAAVVVYMGPGSFFFHATFTEWGGIADAISMHFFILYVLAYEIGRGWSLGYERFRALYFGLAGFFVLQRLIDVPATQVVFAGLVALTLLLELQLAVPRRRLPGWPALGRRREIHGSRGWLLAALGFFLAALAIWSMSDSGRPWCVPDSLWQGHAAWHLLSALTAGSVYLYFCAERGEIVRDGYQHHDAGQPGRPAR